jgi:4-alpha-glucanotransferase
VTRSRRPLLPRSSGILLHPSSLPDGRLGADARAFVDWLAAAGQSWWQVLPLGPPDRHGSPYMPRSAFAGAPSLLSDPDARVSRGDVDRFARSRPWAADWAGYEGPGALDDQVRFEREWSGLRSYAATRGVRLIGDVPIYVAAGSCDHVTHPELFLHGLVAGVPPDDFSDTGQLWGNPLYDWPALRRRGYRWWIERLRRALQLVDLVRVDHFRGFVACWAVPEESTTALPGHWRRGPGLALFRAAETVLGPLPLLAEDLGVITPPVVRLREALGIPGIVVMQYAFGDDPRSPHLLANHGERTVVYTGTHDHAPIESWWYDEATSAERSRADRAARALGITDPEPHWQLVRLALSSRARVAIAPAQDVLGLGRASRMNTPATAEGNWLWRLEPGQLTTDLARRLRDATEAAARI